MLTPRNDNSIDDVKEPFLFTTCSGVPFFSVGLERLESSSIDCDIDGEPVSKIRMDTVKEDGAS
jgi:hypothetical protein